MKLYIFLFLLFFHLVGYGQVDTTYVKAFEYKVSVRTYMSQNFIFLNQEFDSNNQKTFMPNNPVSMGLGFSLRNTIVNISGGLKLDFLRDKKKGKTEAIDLQVHNYAQRVVFDLVYQEYKGFYEVSEDQVTKVYPDLKMKQYGAFAQYVFNNKRFSYKAAFTQNERQLKSAGSFLLGGGLYFSEIQSDSSFVYKEKRTYDNFQVGVSAGYAYTWVLNPKWFISASCTAGMNFGNETISDFGKRRLEVYPTAYPRLSIGYNEEDWSLRFAAVSNILFSSISDDTRLSFYSGNLQLTYIWRFNAFPKLGKKVK